MEIKSRFDHLISTSPIWNRSIAFYGKALGLKEHHRKEASDGSFILVYLTDNETGFLLELTWLKDHTAPYELGENESHLCFRVAGDYDAVRAYHKRNGLRVFREYRHGTVFHLTRTIIGLRYFRRNNSYDKKAGRMIILPRFYH